MMYKTKLILILAFLIQLNKISAQLKVFSDGKVGVGSVNYTGHNFYSFGNENVFEFAGSNLYIKPNWLNHAQIGSSRNYVDFVHPFVGWQTITRGVCTHFSDVRLKKNITDVSNASCIAKIKQMSVKHFQYLDSIFPGGRYFYGMLAQDAQKIVPEAIDSNGGFLTMDYEQMIPLLIGAAKAQITTIDSLKETTDSLKEIVTKMQATCCNQTQARVISTTVSNDSLLKELNSLKQELAYLKENCCRSSIAEIQNSIDYLSQNIPNPFDGTTTIPFVIFNKYRDCYVKIYNLNGEELKSFRVNSEDKQVIVNLQELKSGMYLYSLICDGKLIDSKKMILSK